jgi:hypothetical protein
MPISDEQMGRLFVTVGEMRSDIKYLVERSKASAQEDRRLDARVRKLEGLASKLMMIVTIVSTGATFGLNWLGHKTGLIK